MPESLKGIMSICDEIASILKEQKKLEEAYTYYEKAVNAGERLQETYVTVAFSMRLSMIYKCAGDTAYYLRKIKEAQYYYEERFEMNKWLS